MKRGVALSIASLLASCSGLQHSEERDVQQRHVIKEPIHRLHNEYLYPLDAPHIAVLEKYPWQEVVSGNYARVTKEHFRCKGDLSHPPKRDVRREDVWLVDCEGGERHSLPIKEGKEFIYPILITLLNYVQQETGLEVVVTCGHRCPVHNVYSDSSWYNQNSKHLIGAEVDFYVKGWEKHPERVVTIVKSFYKQALEPLKNNKGYEEFCRLESSQLNVVTAPWYNKEILIKLYKAEEGRDEDNDHCFPYIGIQVRYDVERNEGVHCDPKEAIKNYLR